MSEKFVVFDEEHVWGCGNTEKEALGEAKTWYENADNNFEINYSNGNLMLASCNEDLITFIERNSGNGVKLTKNKQGEAVMANSANKDIRH